METEFKRNCPKCNDVLFYSSKYKLNRANTNDSLCRKCHGKKLSIKMLKYEHCNISKKCPNCDEIINFSNKYKYNRSVENNSLCGSCSKSGSLNPNFGKLPHNYQLPHSNETKRKMRLSTIKYIEKMKLNGGQLIPSYNISSIPILELKAKELGITDLQHAENGGEFYIKELGYWVDGYSKQKNIVIEYNEKWHNRQSQKDNRRQKEIVDFLNCKFILINE
jgi:hypothetical protein